MVIDKDFILFKKILNILIKKGKKTLALRIFLKLLKNLNSIENSSSWEIIYKSFNNIKPIIHVKKVRKSSKIFTLPKLIDTEQKINISLRWILKSVSSRKERKLEDRLTNEFLDCFFGKGSTIAKKQSLYDVILVNRPFLNLLIYK